MKFSSFDKLFFHLLFKRRRKIWKNSFILLKRKQILVDSHKLLHRVHSAFAGVRKGNICLKWVTSFSDSNGRTVCNIWQSPFPVSEKNCVNSIPVQSFTGPYSGWMREITDQKNSEYGHFLLSEMFCWKLLFGLYWNRSPLYKDYCSISQSIVEVLFARKQ